MSNKQKKILIIPPFQEVLEPLAINIRMNMLESCVLNYAYKHLLLPLTRLRP